ncbi:dihydropyrimidinase [Candidatus Bipolaricaulota bacterium]|nr:dihydropyrimidinase [Candidatus Bipolaricaulota bacterium]
MKFLIRGGKIVLSNGIIIADLLVVDEKIAAMGKDLAASFPVDRTIDATGKFIFPGLIDAHVHLPWESDGVSSGDDFSSGTKAAICGGVTTIIDFAVPVAGESITVAVERRIDEAEGACYTDFSLHAAVTYFDASLPEEIARVVERGITSFKLYMLYPGLRLDSGEIYQIMHWVKEAGGLIGVHAENGDIIHTRRALFLNQGHKEPFYHYLSSPAVVEADAVNQILFLNEHVGGRLYFVHVSAGESLALIARAKDRGQTVYAETCPHYLALTAAEYNRPDGYLFLVSPSLKSADDRDALWNGVMNGSVDFISTDHCPFSREQKEVHKDDFTAVPNGMPGVETRLPILLTEGYWHRRVPLERIVALTSYTPARVFGLFPQKGTLQPGSDADLVILDLEKEWTLRHEDLHMNVDWSPYEEWRCRGLPELVMRRGEIMYEDGEWIADSAHGQFIPRKIN